MGRSTRLTEPSNPRRRRAVLPTYISPRAEPYVTDAVMLPAPWLSCVAPAMLAGVFRTRLTSMHATAGAARSNASLWPLSYGTP